MLTAEEAIRKDLASYTEIVYLAQEIASQVLQVQRPGRKVDSLIRIEFELEQVIATWTDFCMGSSSDDFIVFPLSYLWTDNYAEVERERLRIAAEQREQDAAAERDRKAAEQQERDKVELARLKALYEPSGSHSCDWEDVSPHDKVSPAWLRS